MAVCRTVEACCRGCTVLFCMIAAFDPGARVSRTAIQGVVATHFHRLERQGSSARRRLQRLDVSDERLRAGRAEDNETPSIGGCCTHCQRQAVNILLCTLETAYCSVRLQYSSGVNKIETTAVTGCCVCRQCAADWRRPNACYCASSSGAERSTDGFRVVLACIERTLPCGL